MEVRSFTLKPLYYDGKSTHYKVGWADPHSCYEQWWWKKNSSQESNPTHPPCSQSHYSSFTFQSFQIFYQFSL